ncbi:formylmethanofuran dehydrogenase subunit C [Parasulfuritortus cantonensis]|uniref:Formylmethanofuran dehydrogenase subunit C n=1 Tax=Parasulfuritortus cantonensis TaxID=2528202 RepID=A0A4R1B5U3_9PROT|nr:formylmethanofuran dehydrogenase subunit C [Parasulfuritortus cantonensis]TCJ11897.1 formylmethanofuran dehydrogenase subunit C [Parasulfuritortus cantonensis]
MTATTLTLRAGIAGTVDLGGVLPETLVRADAGRLVVGLDGRPVELAELFTLRPGDADSLVVEAEGVRLDNVGRAMTAGRLRLEGHAGDYAGEAMRGGELLIAGDAGDFAACAMRAGLLRIDGRAGDWLAAARTGERAGMAGGVVAVAGGVGDRLGDRMRRGLVLVRGRAGRACGARMLAGTLAVAGGCDDLAGFGLRRGSLVLGVAPELGATFNEAGVADLPWLGLLRRYADAILPGAVFAGTRARRWQGDLAQGGKGEVLVPACG